MKVEVDQKNKTVRINLPGSSSNKISDAMIKFDDEIRETEEWKDWQGRKNHKYAIKYNEKLYPVKKIISLTTGVSVSHFSGGEQSNSYIKEYGFEVIALRDNEWSEIIVQIRKKHITNERIHSRKDAENQARNLIENQIGNFDEDNLKKFFSFLNVDFENGKSKKDRFRPAFMGANANKLIEQIDIFNEWSKKLWQTPINEISGLLNDFWITKPLVNAGIILPTAILYLRSKKSFNIMCKPMIAGISVVTGKIYHEYSSEDYMQYNDDICQFRDQYHIEPQELDIILYYIGKEEQLLPPPKIGEQYTLEQCSDDTGISEKELARWVRAIESKGQAIFYGPPGTGKTFIAEKIARNMVSGGNGVSDIIQFHPSYSYEDFIQGIRPMIKGDGALHYPVVQGRFIEFCKKAESNTDMSVLIIDEINRANLSRVFGELMYLLEYRDREVPLAAGGSFKIPSNVRIIGTMNTADRSIALVDHALRRRFAFISLYPRFDILKSFHANTGFEVDGLIKVLKHLNNEIGDSHYHVGITYFLKNNLSSKLEDIWKMELEPYLEEFFFDRPDRVEEFRWENVKERI